MSAMILLDKIDRALETRTSFIFALFVVMAAFCVGEDIATAIRRAKEHPASRFADDSNIIVESAGAAARIQNGCRAVSQSAEKCIPSSDRHRSRRRRRDFLLERRSEHKPVRREVVSFCDVGQKIVADVELRMYV